VIKMEKYLFREYNSKYKNFFLKEKNTITEALWEIAS